MQIRQRLLLLLLFISIGGTGCSLSALLGGDSAVGELAPEYLRNNPYSQLHIEIQAMPGFLPTQAAISDLQSFLNKYVNKSGGITVSTREIPSAGAGVYSVGEVQDVREQNQQHFTNGST